jgi:S-DNA-T family DNA segregation ATPase FtsK/SpoIIIE
VIQYWIHWAALQEWVSGAPPWEQVLDQMEEEPDDELLTRAIDIVREQGSASASMLQRRMRIGYPRASRLVDEMEELGIVGPTQGGGRPRKVLDPGPEPG